MRAVLLLALALGGCMGPFGTDPSCPASDAETTGPRVIHVQLASTMDHPACVRLLIDGVAVAGAALSAEDTGLHANPVPAGEARASAGSVLVRVEEAGTSRAYEELVLLHDETWLVAWLDENGATIETYAREPAWM